MNLCIRSYVWDIDQDVDDELYNNLNRPTIIYVTRAVRHIVSDQVWNDCCELICEQVEADCEEC